MVIFNNSYYAHQFQILLLLTFSELLLPYCYANFTTPIGNASNIDTNTTTSQLDLKTTTTAATTTSVSSTVQINFTFDKRCLEVNPAFYTIGVNEHFAIYGSNLTAAKFKCNFALSSPPGNYVRVLFYSPSCNTWPDGYWVQVWNGYNFETPDKTPTATSLLMIFPPLNGGKSSCLFDGYSLANVVSVAVSAGVSSNFSLFFVGTTSTSNKDKGTSSEDKAAYAGFIGLAAVFLLIGFLSRLFCFDKDCPRCANQSSCFLRTCYYCCTCCNTNDTTDQAIFSHTSTVTEITGTEPAFNAMPIFPLQNGHPHFATDGSSVFSPHINGNLRRHLYLQHRNPSHNPNYPGQHQAEPEFTCIESIDFGTIPELQPSGSAVITLESPNLGVILEEDSEAETNIELTEINTQLHRMMLDEDQTYNNRNHRKFAETSA